MQIIFHTIPDRTTYGYISEKIKKGEKISGGRDENYVNWHVSLNKKIKENGSGHMFSLSEYIGNWEKHKKVRTSIMLFL